MNIAVFTYHENFSFALVSFERHLSYTDVGEELYNNNRSRLDGVQTLIIRPPVERSIKDRDAEREKCRLLMGRFPSFAIYLLYSTGFRLCLSYNLQQGPELGPFPFEEAAFLDFCRQRELEDFVLQSRAILRSPEQSVYRTPSQEYTTAFLRVGNIQQRRLVLDIIFFWLLPRLQHAGAVLTDSWSISSIGLNIGRLLSRYRQTCHPPEDKDNFHVNFLSAYYDGRRGMERETKEALLPLLYANDHRIIFLISAVKTRKSLDILQAELERQGYWGKMDVVALYCLQPGISVESLCPLFGAEFLQKADLTSGFMSHESPPEGTTVVVIDETTFMPTVPRVRELPLRKELADCSQAFFDRYLGLGAITVHRDARFVNGTLVRHHGLFVDVGILLYDQGFLAKLKDKVDEMEKKPDLIIYPQHEQGKLFVDELLKLLGEKFEGAVAVESFASLDEFAEARQKEIKERLLGLTEDALILIVDDVMTTGSRLKNYQKFLRELPYAGEIFYLVGVARTQDQSLLNSLGLELRYRDENRKHRFEFVEAVFLPDWGREDCPWCRETKILDELAEAAVVENPELRRSLAQRQVELTKKLATGLGEDAFFSVNQDGKARFAGKSVFCEKPGITEAELIARIAATVHFCKMIGVKVHDGRVKLGAEYPVFTIIRSRQYLSLGRTFNDALIMSAILRTCGSQELYAVEDTQLQAQKTAILQLISNGSLPANERCFFIYELLLALKAAKLPTPAGLSDWDAVLGRLLRQ